MSHIVRWRYEKSETVDSGNHQVADRCAIHVRRRSEQPARQYECRYENRGWAATAMMQIFLTDKKTAEKSLVHLKEAIRAEKDTFALQMMLVSIQEITGKKLGLRSTGNERAPKETVDTALKKALKLLNGSQGEVLFSKQEGGTQVTNGNEPAVQLPGHRG